MSEIAPVIGARFAGTDAQFQSVSTDTRTLQPGELYVALKGENFDGNAFAGLAAEKGACGAVVSSDVTLEIPTLKVSDTGAALGALARWNRQQCNATVVAITGSQGKTTVKEMTGAILKLRGETLVTRGNLNNHVGAPLTLLEMNGSHQFAVIELGASGAGEIAYTVSLTLPHVVVLNNAAAAHLEGFGSLQGVVEAKGEIIDGVNSAGTVVLNADDPHFPVWKQRAAARKVHAFSVSGSKPEADYTAENIRMHAGGGSEFDLLTPYGKIEVSLALPGRHNLANALAAAAAAAAAGASLEEIRDGLGAVRAVPGRLRPLAGVNGCRLIDDSYNASPGSFRAAVDVLAACPGERILIVGDMAELGESAEDSHREVGRYAAAAGLDQLWSVGPLSALAATAFGEGQHFADQDALIAHARAHLGAHSTALIKGSRSSRMDRIVAQLSFGETR